mmetsp:Transcript_6341/g.12012  ORF Transcript_6341/g.12012 Transcript_6341/m.12012 type:complete len:259 (-) Transcript_6341:179-955(-)
MVCVHILVKNHKQKSEETMNNIYFIHIQAGFPLNKLSEIHGNIFTEKCEDCLTEYTRATPVEKETAENHETGNTCEKCGGDLFDVIVHFGEELRGKVVANAKAKGATMSVAIGTKLKVEPAATWVFRPHQKKVDRGKVVLINLQETSSDADANTVIHHEAAVVLAELCKQLGVKVSDPTPKRVPVAASGQQKKRKAAASSSGLKELRVAELKERLSEKGFSTTGLKKVLVRRLQAALDDEKAAPALSSKVPANKKQRQ